MGQNLQELFKNATHKPNENLSDSVCKAVVLKSRSMARRNISMYLGVCALSFFGSIFFIKDLITESSNLGFFSYLSLIFSDSSIVVNYCNDYILTLVDSLPVASLVLSVSLLFLLVLSLRKVSSHLRSKLSLI